MCFCPTSGFVLGGPRCQIHLLPYSASRELSWASGFVKNTPAAKSAKLLQSCPTLCDPIDGRQPTRLPSPWDSPGKNTGVGCHFLLQCMKVKSESEVVQSCLTLCDPMDCSLSGSSVHYYLLYVTNLCPYLGTLSIRSNPLNLFVTSTV